jgi:alkylation response protein AidB-like acyl-CoA dehydrogenase
MEFDLSEEQRLWQQTVHAFCQRELKPKAAEIDQQAALDLDLIARMAPLGLLGLNVSLQDDGPGIDAVGAALAIEELGWACGSTALSVAAHNGLCCAPIALFGDAEQRSRWLPALMSGKHGLGALALTEPSGGSDLVGSVATRAELRHGKWHIKGAKAWITNAGQAPVIVTLCVTDPQAGAHGLSLIVVTGGAPGLHIHPPEKKLGTRGSPAHAVTYDDVEIPQDFLLGKQGAGLRQTLQVLDGGRVGIAALCVGLARAAFEAAGDYALGRQSFGKRLIDHQALRFMLADAAAHIEAARLLVYRAAWLKQMGRPFTLEASMAKLVASEMAEQVCRDAIQVMGAYGYSQEMPVERMYRDARLMTIGEGTSEVQRMVIARRLFDTPGA